MFVGQFRYTIVHNPGEQNHWDLLSRWMKEPQMAQAGNTVQGYVLAVHGEAAIGGMLS